ncbi:plant virulence effector HPE1-like domain-containing protein [Rhizobium sp.]
MRLHILILALLSSAATAQAGSIDVVKTGKDRVRSIETISCSGCVARARKKVEPVIELAPGTQRIEIRDVNGVKKVFRTEAWMGGSPVTYVSKALPDDPAVIDAEAPVKIDDVAVAPDAVIDTPEAPVTADMIDEQAKTSAVTADEGAEAKVEVTSNRAAFDAGKLELRIN